MLSTQHLRAQVLNIPEPRTCISRPGGLTLEAIHNFAVEAAPVSLGAFLQVAQQVFRNVVERVGGHGTDASSKLVIVWQATSR